MSEAEQMQTEEQLSLDIGDLLSDTLESDPTQDDPADADSTVPAPESLAAPAAPPPFAEPPVAGAEPPVASPIITPLSSQTHTDTPALTELEQARAEAAQLRTAFAEFMSNRPDVPVPPSAPALAPVQTPLEQRPMQLSNFAAVNDIITKLKTPQNFLSAEQLDQLVDKPELVNTALNGVVSTLVDNFSSIIPAIAASVAHEQILLTNMARDFYDANKDLAPYRDFVAATSKAVERDNPNASYQEIFSKVATQVREKLALRVPTVESVPIEPGVRPAFAGVRGAARPAVGAMPAKTVRTEIADLLS